MPLGSGRSASWSAGRRAASPPGGRAGHAPERAVGPDLIAVLPPALDGESRVVQAGEPVLVQALVPTCRVGRNADGLLDDRPKRPMVCRRTPGRCRSRWPPAARAPEPYGVRWPITEGPGPGKKSQAPVFSRPASSATAVGPRISGTAGSNHHAILKSMFKRALDLPTPGTETFFLGGAAPDRQEHAAAPRVRGGAVDRPSQG